MRLVCLLLLALGSLTNANAQAPGGGAGPAAPDSTATLNYIHGAWETLTRRVTDCEALKDSKGPGEAVVYLPAEMAATPELGAVEEKCHVKLKALPRRIEKLGDVRPEELAAEGLLYLPNAYVVAGGRFNEMVGWDGYFIVLGLEADHKEALAKGMVDNFLFEVEHYGAVLNANQTYSLTRSQPPLLTSMIRAVIENPASFAATPQGRIEERSWLAHAYAMAEKDHSTWIRPEHLAGTTGLARYFDYGSGPAPEMSDDSTYYADVIRWLVGHPKAGGEGFLVKGPEHPDAAEAARLKLTSCDVKASVVCARAWAQGYRLSKDFYAGGRAMRESGYDPSFRFGPFSGATQHFAPVCLNSLLYRYERDMEHLAHLLVKPREAVRWEMKSKRRLAAIQRYLWRAKDGVFADFDFAHAKGSSYAYVTSLYPLWAGVATREQETEMVKKLDLFERAGGLSMSATASGLEGDEPYGGAPANWIVVAGLQANGYRTEAARIAREFVATVDKGFERDGMIRETYNVVAGDGDVKVSEGYKENGAGFGGTNGVYLKMKEVVREAEAHPAHE